MLGLKLNHVSKRGWPTDWSHLAGNSHHGGMEPYHCEKTNPKVSTVAHFWNSPTLSLLMAVTWCMWHMTPFMWHPSLCGVSMVVADGLAPIWCLDIGNHHDDVGCLEYINGLVQERRNSSANALELRLSCTNLSILCMFKINEWWSSNHLTYTMGIPIHWNRNVIILTASTSQATWKVAQ